MSDLAIALVVVYIVTLVPFLLINTMNILTVVRSMKIGILGHLGLAVVRYHLKAEYYS